MSDNIKQSDMVLSESETDEWKLGCYLEWRPKDKLIDCHSCGGSGVVGGHFKDIDGERPCPQCFGTKYKRVGPITRMPEIPLKLREHMRRAWLDYHNSEA